MRECPKGCGSMLADDAICCNTCGWSAPAVNRVDRHPVHGYRLCEHEDRGQRCGGAGAFSSNLREGGPWYCFDHFPPFTNWNKTERTAPPMGFQALRDLALRVKA